MEEIWKAIKGYEGRYEVSNLGRVRSFDKVLYLKNSSFMHKGRIIKLRPGKTSPYLLASLSSNGVRKVKLVHRLVAEAFIDNSELKPEVNHKNGVKTDNRASNLEWVTSSENKQHALKMLPRKTLTSTNKSGFSGVSLHKSTGKWQASLTHNGKRVYVGIYQSPEEAHKALLCRKEELYKS